MRMKIVNGWLEIDGAAAMRFDSPHQGGRMTPALIVLHDTAGRLESGSSVSWFLDKASKVSAHFVIERDGRVTQMVACDRQAWHAGKSTWKGRANCNGFSVGIEIVNPGQMAAKGARAVTWFGQVFEREALAHRIVPATTDQHGSGLWMDYTREQIATVEALIAALVKAYPTIRDVAGHVHISPGRKVDPNPLFPERIYGAVKKPRLADPAEADVAAAQQALAGLGYPTGTPDGALGPRTEAAVFAFQKQNDLEAHGKLDPATVAAIKDPAAKPMPTGAREAVTEADLAPVSRTVSEQQTERGENAIIAGLGVFTALSSALAGAGQAVKQAMTDFGPDVVLLALGGAAAAYGIRGWRRSNRTIGYRVEDARTGVHSGPVAAPNS